MHGLRDHDRGWRSYTQQFCFVLLWVARSTCADPIGELDDAAARLQFAYYSNDARALEQSLTVLADLDAGPLVYLRDYYLGYGHWRIAELYSQKGAEARAPKNPTSAMQRCKQELERAIAAQANFAEAHALHAVCSTRLREMSATKRSTSSCEDHKSLHKALQLEPKNPRVQLVAALCMLGSTREREQILARLQGVAAAFDAAPVSRPGQPDWGHAETWFELGRLHLERRDRLAARNALERALVIAPDYQQAQALLHTVAAGSR